MEPGPASTVEERSLRKNFVRGDRGSKLAVEESFQMLRALYLTGVSTYRTSQSTHATSISEWLYAATNHCMKGNVARINWPIISLRNSTNTKLQPVGR